MSLLEPTDFVLQVNFVCVAICQGKACGAKSIVLHKAAINDLLCQVSCVIYMLKLRTLSMHQCAFVKKDSFLSMYVIQATGEENY